jgi:hypothetical protein
MAVQKILAKKVKKTERRLSINPPNALRKSTRKKIRGF